MCVFMCVCRLLSASNICKIYVYMCELIILVVSYPQLPNTQILKMNIYTCTYCRCTNKASATKSNTRKISLIPQRRGV